MDLYYKTILPLWKGIEIIKLNLRKKNLLIWKSGFQHLSSKTRKLHWGFHNFLMYKFTMWFIFWFLTWFWVGMYLCWYFFFVNTDTARKSASCLDHLTPVRKSVQNIMCGIICTASCCWITTCGDNLWTRLTGGKKSYYWYLYYTYAWEKVD